MNVAFLGESTEEKRFLILCLAKIASYHRKYYSVVEESIFI